MPICTRLALLSLATIFGLSLVVGCSPKSNMPPAGVVRGSITYKGKPVTGGTIVFHSVADPTKNGAGLIKPDGTYQSFDAPPGDAKVTVIGPDPRSSASAYPGQTIPKGAVVKDAPPEARVGTTPKLVALPSKYAKPESTPLSFTVKEGDRNTFDIELTD